MIVGFTGTRHGMTAPQRAEMLALLEELDGIEFHHGDCVGADEQAADLAHELGYHLVGHPPTKPDLRAYHPHTQDWKEPRPYLRRNRNIVRTCDVLVAAIRSGDPLTAGTWRTVRAAREPALLRPIRLVTPGGAVLDGSPRLTENTA